MSQVMDRFYIMFHLIPSRRKELQSSPARTETVGTGKIVKTELEEMGAQQVRLSEYGYVYAEIPSIFRQTEK